MIAAISYPPIPIFEVGPFALSLHGLFAGLGFVAGAMLMLREVRRRGYDADGVASVLTWALVASILGARLFTVPANLGTPGYGISNVIGLAGDFSILGGYAGGIMGGVLRMRMLGLHVLPLLDAAAPGLAIGAVIGRIGDLAIVEHLGSTTTFFLGYTIKPGYDVSPQHDLLECTADQAVNGICGTYHHSALYDMLGAIVLLVFLVWLRRRWTGRHYGQMFTVWMMWYGFQRFLIDFTRLGGAENGTTADSVIGPFTGSQWGGLGAALLGALLFVWYRRNPVVSEEQDEAYQAIEQGVERLASLPDDVPEEPGVGSETDMMETVDSKSEPSVPEETEGSTD